VKISLNSRTEAKLNEIMRMTNETSAAHVINLMTSAFLDSLKAANNSPADGDHNDNQENQNLHAM
jgi:hypothetical protein